MKEFQLLDYYTEYSCKGLFEKKMKREYCFSFVFNKVKIDPVSEEYTLILYKGTNFSKQKHYSNACIFNKQQIRNHLKQAQSIYPFKYRVTELKNWKGYNVFKVHLILSDIPGTFHKYILTWIRYMYEYPYNVILYDAYKLKKERCFCYSSISNLFNLVLGCYCNNPRTIHQIAKNEVSKRMSKQELKEKIQNVVVLNDIYKQLKVKKQIIPKTVLNKTITDIEYWEDQEIFDTYRKPVYMKVYKETLR